MLGKPNQNTHTHTGIAIVPAEPLKSNNSWGEPKPTSNFAIHRHTETHSLRANGNFHSNSLNDYKGSMWQWHWTYLSSLSRLPLSASSFCFLPRASEKFPFNLVQRLLCHQKLTLFIVCRSCFWLGCRCFQRSNKNQFMPIEKTLCSDRSISVSFSLLRSFFFIYCVGGMRKSKGERCHHNGSNQNVRLITSFNISDGNNAKKKHII